MILTNTDLFLSTIRPRMPNHEFFRLPEDDDLNQSVAVGLDDYQMNGCQNLVKGSAHNFIILHIPPPVEIYRFHSFIKNGDNFIALMKRYASRIALVFSGHIHGYGEAEQMKCRPI